MLISVHLKPDISQALQRECKRQNKTRSALIQEALDAYLTARQRNLADAFAEALAASPGGFGIERAQPGSSSTREWAG